MSERSARWPSLQFRLFSQIDQQGPALSEELGPCWLWRGGIKKNGYGTTFANGRRVNVHRFMWILFCGEIADGLQVLHRCDVRHCVRIDHLFLGTHQDNMDDMREKGRAPTWEERSRVMKRVAARGETHGSKTQPESRAKGSRNGTAKLSDQKVLRIRAQRAAGRTLRAIGEEFGVSQALVCMICTRKIWTHI